MRFFQARVEGTPEARKFSKDLWASLFVLLRKFDIAEKLLLIWRQSGQAEF
jgi:hypothetical protein